MTETAWYPLALLAIAVGVPLLLAVAGLFVALARLGASVRGRDLRLATGEYRVEEGCTNGTCWCYWYRLAIPLERENGRVYVACASGTGHTPAAARAEAERLMNQPR